MTLLLDAPPAAPPRFRYAPTYTSSAGQDCIDLAEEAGLILDPWQRAFIIDALAEGPDGLWAAMQVALVVPRQNGKGGILEALELFCLFMVADCRLITHTAHRFDTCLDHFRRLRGLVEQTPDLLAMVKDNGRGVNGMPSGIKDSNGKESIELADGSRLNFKAREKGSGRGFTGDLIVFDEAFYLGTLTGLVSALSARRNPQIWFTSSAPLPDAVSDSLRQIIRDGRALAAGTLTREPGEPGEVYVEYSAECNLSDPVALARLFDDPAALRAANPSTEVGRINETFCKVERRLYTDEEYARERYGIFPVESDAPKWLVVPEASWLARLSQEDEAQAAEPGWLTGPVTLAIELTQDRATGTIGAAGACREGGVGLEVVARGEGTAWIVPHVVKLKADEDRPVGRVVIDPRSPAGSLIPDLTEAGVEVTECPTVDLVKATGSLIDAIGSGGVVHRGTPELTESVASSVLRKYGDASLIDRWSGGDPTPFIAVDLARWGYMQGEDADPVSVYEERGLVEL